MSADMHVGVSHHMVWSSKLGPMFTAFDKEELDISGSFHALISLPYSVLPVWSADDQVGADLAALCIFILYFIL
jgi:hypothetical protein